jgi:hypothetical protein
VFFVCAWYGVSSFISSCHFTFFAVFVLSPFFVVHQHRIRNDPESRAAISSAQISFPDHLNIQTLCRRLLA